MANITCVHQGVIDVEVVSRGSYDGLTEGNVFELGRFNVFLGRNSTLEFAAVQPQLNEQRLKITRNDPVAYSVELVNEPAAVSNIFHKLFDPHTWTDTTVEVAPSVLRDHDGWFYRGDGVGTVAWDSEEFPDNPGEGGDVYTPPVSGWNRGFPKFCHVAKAIELQQEFSVSVSGLLGEVGLRIGPQAFVQLTPTRAVVTGTDRVVTNYTVVPLNTSAEVELTLTHELYSLDTSNIEAYYEAGADGFVIDIYGNGGASDLIDLGFLTDTGGCLYHCQVAKWYEAEDGVATLDGRRLIGVPRDPDMDTPFTVSVAGYDIYDLAGDAANFISTSANFIPGHSAIGTANRVSIGAGVGSLGVSRLTISDGTATATEPNFPQIDGVPITAIFAFPLCGSLFGFTHSVGWSVLALTDGYFPIILSADMDKYWTLGGDIAPSPVGDPLVLTFPMYNKDDYWVFLHFTVAGWEVWTSGTPPSGDVFPISELCGTPEPPDPPSNNMTPEPSWPVRPIQKAEFVNMYPEATPRGPRQFTRYQRPAVRTFDEQGEGPVHFVTFLTDSGRYVASGDTLYVNGAEIGSYAVDGSAVRWAQSLEQVVIVSAGIAYLVDVIGATLTPIVIPDDKPVLDVVQLADRFVYMILGTSQFYWSDVNDAATIDPLSFATADANSDANVGMAVLGNEIAMFQDRSVEWWYPVSDIDAPFQRSNGRTYSKGCRAIETIRLVDNSLYWLGDDKVIYRTGSVPIRVSNHEVEWDLRRTSEVQITYTDATVLPYGGHTFYLLTTPGTARPNEDSLFGTWAYDVEYKEWVRWKSWGKDRFRVRAFGADIAGDAYSGRLFSLEGRQCYDNFTLGEGAYDWSPIERKIFKFFPLNSPDDCNNVVIYMWNGVSLAAKDVFSDGVQIMSEYGRNAVVEMRYTDDEGMSYSEWRQAEVGLIGETQIRCVWWGCGQMRAPGRAFEFRCTDPIFYTVFDVLINVDTP